MIIFPNIIFILQSTQESVFEKYFWAIILLVVTNGLQYLNNLRKLKSDVGKTDTEKRKTDVETYSALLKEVRGIQDRNMELYGMMEGLQKKNDTVAEDLRESRQREETKDDLFEKIIDLFIEIKPLLVKGSLEENRIILKMSKLDVKIKESVKESQKAVKPKEAK